MQIRPLSVADAAAITELLARAEAAEPSENHFGLAEVTEMLTGPDVDLARGSVGFEDNGQLLGAGLLDLGGDGDVFKVTARGEIDPDRWRRGLGTLLMQHLEQAAVELRDADAPGRSGLFQVWLTAGRTSATALVESLGLATVRHYLDMGRVLDGDLPVGPAPEGIEIIPWQAELDEAVRLVSNSAWRDHYGSTSLDPAHWAARYSRSSTFRPSTSRLALAGSEVVAFCLVTEYDGETQAHGYRTGYLARIGTLTEHRGRGIASAMVAATLRALADDGCVRAELTVDAASPTGAGRVYQRLGFATLRHNRMVGRPF